MQKRHAAFDDSHPADSPSVLEARDPGGALGEDVTPSLSGGGRCTSSAARSEQASVCSSAASPASSLASAVAPAAAATPRGRSETAFYCTARPELENASPAVEVEIKNPLSRAEFFSFGKCEEREPLVRSPGSQSAASRRSHGSQSAASREKAALACSPGAQSVTPRNPAAQPESFSFGKCGVREPLVCSPGSQTPRDRHPVPQPEVFSFGKREAHEHLACSPSSQSAASLHRSSSAVPERLPFDGCDAREPLVGSPGSSALERNPLLRPELLSFGRSDAPEPLVKSPAAESCASVDSFSMAPSCAPSCPSMLPSAAPSPFVMAASASATPFASPMPKRASGNAPASDAVSVRILNGVSGEEETRFRLPLQDAVSEQHFLAMLDRQCKRAAGQSLADLNWLRRASGQQRYERRKPDLHMVDELLGSVGPQNTGKTVVLLLCAVPVQPPSELIPSKVRLKSLIPCKISGNMAKPVRLQLNTSCELEADVEYSIAFTHQISNMTYSVEAELLDNRRGVASGLPWQLTAEGDSNTAEGLYDVHLIIGRASRSENRRALTIASGESELSSSSTARSTSAALSRTTAAAFSRMTSAKTMVSA